MAENTINICNNPEAHILIVDDVEMYSQLLAIILKKNGYKNISTCNDPINAVSQYLEIQPDVMLLDYDMPEINGIDILISLQEILGDVYLPVLMLTAEDNRELKINALSNGAQDFIAKPFDNLDVLARINKIIDGSLQQKKLQNKAESLDQAVQSSQNKLQEEQEHRKAMEVKLQHNLMHDHQTGLPNKALFYDRASQLIKTAIREKSKFAIVVFNLVNIREINNTLGYKFGDQIISEIGQRLTAQIRDTDSVTFISENSHDIARLSGNSFVATLPDIQSDNDSLHVTQRILSELSKPFQLEEINIEVLTYTGIVNYPEHGDNIDDLLQRADIAAYTAETSKTPCVIYSPEHDKFTTFKLMLSQELKNAIANDELQIYLQAKVNLKTDKIYGFEALLRWMHPSHGFVNPEEIVDVAESTGMITELTQWVIKKTIEVNSQLVKMGHKQVLSLNYTSSDLLNPNMFTFIVDKIKEENINPELFTIEITEGSMIEDPNKALDLINTYNKAGLSLSIDDFGTGFSSLAYLQKLPVQELKIDKSFVLNLNENIDDQMIVQSIIDIAHHFNMKVVAEGIENQASYEMLATFGCDYAQGFHLSRPVPIDEAFALLETDSLVRKT